MELGDPTSPGLFLSFLISVQVIRQPYSCVGARSDPMSVLLPVSLVLDVSQAPHTPPPGPMVGRGARKQKSSQGKKRPKLHTASCSPLKENAVQ